MGSTLVTWLRRGDPEPVCRVRERMAESRMRQVVAIRFFTRRRGGPTIRRMTGTGWTLALISVALAVGIALLDQLPRRVRVLVVFSVMGAVFGVLMLVGRTWERTCELSD